MNNLKKFILQQVSKENLSIEDAQTYLNDIEAGRKSKEVAIIGMACRFPKSNNIYEYWDNLINSRECLDSFPKNRIQYAKTFQDNYGDQNNKPSEEKMNESYEFKAGYLEDVDKFDAAFFNIPPREAKHMDPRQRVFLEVAWSAIEDAGYSKKTIYGTNTGVYVGEDKTGTTFYRMLVKDDPLIYTGTWEGILASRLSYIFNFKGPAMVIDTACSSGLVALHSAAKAIRNGECELAVAGGVAMGTMPQRPSSDSDDVIASVQAIDNHVRTFDAKSSGTIFGEGVGAVLLKDYEKAIQDGDHIYAIIKGSAINNDGASNGITAPSSKAQEEVICKAWEDAGVHADEIDYIEAHGTGTLLGDPIEIKGINNSFARYTNKKQICGIGTAKTIMGHLVAASGIAGLIKVALSMKHEVIPAMKNFEEANPHIDFINSPVYVVDRPLIWKQEGKKRIAGISAFGFSGTNCHVVVEEAPETSEEQIIENIEEIVAFSAKTEESLLRTIDCYIEYISRNQDVNMRQFAYTLNTGRGDYEHRLALVVSNLNELKQKLESIKSTGLKFIEVERAVYSVHRVVSDKKESVQLNDISNSDKKRITEEVKARIEELPAARDITKLLGICQRYVKGADIEWEDLYAGENIKKISLPTYCYEKTLYWGEPVNYSNSVITTGEKIFEHPFIDYLVTKTPDSDVYSVKMSIDTHWALDEHKILGKNMMSGTSLIEMIRAVGALYYDEVSIQLSDVMFFTPLGIEQGEVKDVQIVVKKINNEYEVTIASKNKLGQMIIHTKGKFSKLIKQDKRIAIDELLNNESFIQLNVKDIYNEATSKDVIGFGPRWDVVKSIGKSEKDVLAEIELGEEFAKDLDTYLLHPSILDNAVNNMGTLKFGEGMYLPFSYKCLKFYRPMTRKIYSHCIFNPRKEDTKRETLSFDITLTDSIGNVIAEITEYTVKRVRKPSEISGKANQYYKIKWIEDKAIFSENWAAGTVVIFKDSNNISNQIAERLMKQGNEVILISFAEKSEKISDTEYTLSIDERDFYNLFEMIKHKNITHIIHAATITEKQKLANVSQFQLAREKGVDSLFYLVKALINNRFKNKIVLIMISRNAFEVTKEESYIDPLSTAFLSMGKIIPMEYANIFTRAIDISDSTTINAIISEITVDIFSSFNDNMPHYSRIALRNSKRFIEHLYQVNKIADITKVPTKIRNKGAYIITGGLGAIGQEVSKYLVNESNVNLCYINRSKFPSRSLWHDILEKGEDKKKISQIKAINYLESLGATVKCYSADISDYEAVKAIIDDVHKNFGNVNGVIHCAGLPGDGFIIRKEKSEFNRVTSPKMQGTWIIDELTKEDKMDFMFLCSSMVTASGAPGQSDYVAANSYLDGYSSMRNKLGKRTVTINWTAWSEAGMAVDKDLKTGKVLYSSLTSDSGREVFEEILQSDLCNVITGELDYSTAITIGMNQELVMKVSDEIRKGFDRVVRKMSENYKKSKANSIGDIVILGKNDADYTEIEKVLATIYSMVLNVEEIDIFDSFHDMGGDSILATQLLKAIDSQYSGIVDITDIFSKSSVNEMAEYIESKLVSKEEAQTQKDIKSILDNIEAGDLDVEDALSYMNMAQ